MRKTSKAAEEEVRVYRRALAAGADTVTEETVLANLQQICGMLGSNPPQSLDQVVEPSWITAAVGASTSVSASSDRESLLTEINALGTPEFDKGVLAAWNALVSSERARLLPRASLVREAKRLLEARSIEAGRCPLCGQKVDEKVLARRIEGALVEMMEAARDLEQLSRSDVSARRKFSRVRSNSVRRFTIAPGRMQLEIPPVPGAAGPEDTRPGRCAGTRRHRRDHEPSRRRASLGQGGGQAGATALTSRTRHARQSAGDAGGAVPADQGLAAGGEKECPRATGAGAG